MNYEVFQLNASQSQLTAEWILFSLKSAQPDLHNLSANLYYYKIIITIRREMEQKSCAVILIASKLAGWFYASDNKSQA